MLVWVVLSSEGLFYGPDVKVNTAENYKFSLLGKTATREYSTDLLQE